VREGDSVCGHVGEPEAEGHQTALDLSFAANLRAQRAQGTPLEVTSWYLRAMKHTDGGGKLSAARADPRWAHAGARVDALEEDDG
jgi:hypothetical protein